MIHTNGIDNSRVLAADGIRLIERYPCWHRANGIVLLVRVYEARYGHAAVSFVDTIRVADEFRCFWAGKFGVESGRLHGPRKRAYRTRPVVNLRVHRPGRVPCQAFGGCSSS